MVKNLLFMIFLGCMLLLGIPQQAYSASIISTFDTDLDGWVSVNDPGSTSHVSVEGNGILQVIDLYGENFLYINAPSKFLGNWSGYSDISFDLLTRKWASQKPAAPVQLWLKSGSNTALYSFDMSNIAVGQLADFNTQKAFFQKFLTPSDWEITGDWESIISNVEEFRIYMDIVHNYGVKDYNWIDNIKLTEAAPVPEPSSTIAMLLGLIGLKGRTLKKRKSA